MALSALPLPFVVVGAAVIADKGGFSFGGHAISPSRWGLFKLITGVMYSNNAILNLVCGS